MAGRLDLDHPRYDQSTFSGRAKHFFIVTNPLNLFASSSELDKAKELVQLYRYVCHMIQHVYYMFHHVYYMYQHVYYMFHV